MIDTSHIHILDLIPGGFKKVATTDGGEYAGACPFCGGTDRFRIWPTPRDGNPSYWCRQCDKKGDAISFLQDHSGMTFAEALNKLGIESPNGSTTTSKRGYRNGSDYATQHGLDWVDLERVGWKEVMQFDYDHQCERPALEFKTKGGMRYRFLDGLKPPYKSEKGFQRTWYGLDEKVMQEARSQNAPLVLCNGEISAIAARFWGVPAITIAGGAEKRIPDDLLQELQARWDGRIAIALDCDDTGRRYAKEIQEQLGEQGAIIDLGLADGQDLADFVRLHGAGSIKAIKRMMPLPPQSPVTSRDAARLTRDRLDINNVMDGKPVVMPYTIYHHLGGYAKIGWPGKLTAAVAMSGHGKTSWLNSAIDTLMRRGDNGVGVMPEFEADEYHWDRLQRYTGRNNIPFVTAAKMMEWELWKWEHKNNVPMNQRMGYELTPAEKQAVDDVSTFVENWPGEFELFPLTGTLEDVFAEMGDNIQERRTRGQAVTFAAFDYVQILKARSYDDDDNTHEYILGLIKHFCMKHKIHGFVTSQVNKTADKAARASNKVLTTTDMRYVRDDKINCLITLNPLYDELGEKRRLSDGLNYAAIANIAKNNKGQTGKIYQVVDFMHLQWIDQKWDRTSIPFVDEDDL